MNETDGEKDDNDQQGRHRAINETLKLYSPKFCEATIISYEAEYGNSTSQRYQNYCAPAWDGYMCWPETPAGETVLQPCSIYDKNPFASASKKCEPHSEWYIHPGRNHTWTNYSLCFPPSPPVVPGDIDIKAESPIISEWLPIIKTISRVGYAVSFTTLILALAILICIKKLRCPRNTLHMHLFLSFLLRAFMALLKDQLFIDGVGLPNSIINGITGPAFNHETTNWECKLVTSLWQYFILANYTWILMEGLYLHNLIFLAPFTDSSAITAYIFLGWGCPLLVVSSWVLVRIFVDNTLCWTTHTNYNSLFLIIRIPIIITVVLNFIFFVNIVRVLLLKLTSSVSVETRKYRYRKWAKSTLVLVPLFGVHYMVFIGMTYFASDPVVEVVWLFCDQLFASFQGFFVSFLYCLLNGEVRSEVKKIWRNRCKQCKPRRNQLDKQSSFQLQHNSRHNNRSTHDEILSTNGLTLTN